MSKFLHNIVLVGVWWTGMSALAGIFHDLWYTNIVGIDASEGEITKKLHNKGIRMIIWHGKYTVHPKDFVIYTDIDSVKQSPELQQSYALQAQNTKHYHRPFTYSEFLAELSKHLITISIAGTNGKSSCTWLLIHAMNHICPQFGLGIVGALMPDYDNNNYLINPHHTWDIKLLIDHIVQGILPPMDIVKKFFLILEACEFREHFLLYDTDYALITNIGYDHQDCFPTQLDYTKAFQKFIHGVKRMTIVADEKTKEILMTEIMDFHHSSLSSSVQNISENIHPDDYHFTHLFGQHWQINASLVSALLDTIIKDYQEKVWYTFPSQEIKETLQSFIWLRRRMEYLWMTTWWACVYSDYGHHPDAIDHAINATQKQFPDKQLIVYFEPHQAQRLVWLRNEFLATLQQADHVVVFTIYSAREQRAPIVQKTQETLSLTPQDNHHIAQIFAKKISWRYISDEKELINHLDQQTHDKLCLIFSAGTLDPLVRNQFSHQNTS